jgi:hypothetical protein
VNPAGSSTCDVEHAVREISSKSAWHEDEGTWLRAKNRRMAHSCCRVCPWDMSRRGERRG